MAVMKKVVATEEFSALAGCRAANAMVVQEKAEHYEPHVFDPREEMKVVRPELLKGPSDVGAESDAGGTLGISQEDLEELGREDLSMKNRKSQLQSALRDQLNG